MGIAVSSEGASGEQTSGRGKTIWFVVALLFTIANLAGAAFAAWRGEFTHAAVHALLLYFGSKAASALAPPALTRVPAIEESDASLATMQAWQNRLQRIEESLDVVAIEIERIGEGQRFMTRHLASKESSEPEARDGGAPPPQL